MLYDFQTNPIGIIFFTREKKTHLLNEILFTRVLCVV